jgi:hypothetical protein
MVRIAFLCALACISTEAAAINPVLQWTGPGSNGHYYQLLSGAGRSFSEASTLASAATYNGLQGYMMTVTSKGEQDFMLNFPNFMYWINGSDRETEGVWKWLGGPEEGQVFWTGGVNGSTPPGGYANWWFGEPNHLRVDEDYIWVGWGARGRWADAPDAFNYTIIEYGGLSVGSAVPEPSSWALLIAGFGLIGAAARRKRLFA